MTVSGVPATRKFVILYTSNEGSSAIVNCLSGQKGVAVPVFEELDRYKLQTYPAEPDISSLLETVFTTGRFPGFDGSTPYLQPRNEDHPLQAIGFKWRFHGNPLRTARLFQRLEVTVFILSRTDFLDLICSNYVQSYGKEAQAYPHYPAFPQFVVADLEGEERVQYLDTLRQVRFENHPRQFLQAARLRVRCIWHHYGIARILTRYGVRVESIHYEDFCSDSARFLKNLLDKIGVPVETVDTRCDFTRVHGSSLPARIENLGAVTGKGISGIQFRLLKRLYDTGIARIDALQELQR